MPATGLQAGECDTYEPVEIGESIRFSPIAIPCQFPLPLHYISSRQGKCSLHLRILE